MHQDKPLLQTQVDKRNPQRGGVCVGMAKSPKFNVTVAKTKIRIRHKCNQISHDNLNLFGSSMCMPCKHGSILCGPLMTYLVTYCTLNEYF